MPQRELLEEDRRRAVEQRAADPLAAADARPLGRGRWELELTITEGRTREVRRICDALGLEVERLVRTRFGPIELGELPAGAVRQLTPRERRLLAALTGG